MVSITEVLRAYYCNLHKGLRATGAGRYKASRRSENFPCTPFCFGGCNLSAGHAEQTGVRLQRPTEPELHALMVASLAGDAAAYRCLLESLTRILRGYFRRRLFDDLSIHADDLVQETLLALHTRRMTFDPAYPLMAWVHAIARHKLIDFLRRSRRQRQLPLDDQIEFLADPVDSVAASEDRRDIETLLSHLPARSRDVIAKVKIEGKSVAETATESSLSVASVKVIVHRGIAALRNKFGDKP